MLRLWHRPTKTRRARAISHAANPGVSAPLSIQLPHLQCSTQIHSIPIRNTPRSVSNCLPEQVTPNLSKSQICTAPPPPSQTMRTQGILRKRLPAAVELQWNQTDVDQSRRTRAPRARIMANPVGQGRGKRVLQATLSSGERARSHVLKMSRS
jgi:hypothetical protein